MFKYHAFLQAILDYPVEYQHGYILRCFVETNKINESQINPDELIFKVETELPDIKELLNSAISFYFSRPNVVIPLTGRDVPLTKSGMAVY